jgi:hypothetical protein
VNPQCPFTPGVHVLLVAAGHAGRQAPWDEKAIVALARRLAVIMHRIWVDGTEFRWTRDRAAAAA